MTKILFVNGSPNKDGNTASIARKMLDGCDYDVVNLTDYKIYPLGQTYGDDEFDEVMRKMTEADVLIMGSPVYWHSMTGQFRTLLDRIYESPMKHQLHGKKLHFIFQGAGPSKEMLDAGNYTMSVFCRLFGLHYTGMTTSMTEAKPIR